MTDDIIKALRMAAIQQLAGNAHKLLQDVVASAKEAGDAGVAVAALHLQDSFAAFAAACQRSLDRERDDDSEL